MKKKIIKLLKWGPSLALVLFLALSLFSSRAAKALESSDSVSYKIVPILFRPQDQPEIRDLPGKIVRALQEVQAWYGEQMDGRTFNIERDSWGNVALTQVAGDHPAHWYFGSEDCLWGQLTDECYEQALVRIRAELDRKEHSVQTGEIQAIITQGFGFLARADLVAEGTFYRRWYGQASPPLSGYAAMGTGWIDYRPDLKAANLIIAHELGHAFGLPHSFSYKNLMSVGSSNYNQAFGEVNLLNDTDFAEKHFLCKSLFFNPSVVPSSCLFPSNPPPLPPSGFDLSRATLSLLNYNLLMVEASNLGTVLSGNNYRLFLKNYDFTSKILSSGGNLIVTSIFPENGLEINEGLNQSGSCLFNDETDEGSCGLLTVNSYFKAWINGPSLLRVGDVFDLGFLVWGDGSEEIPGGAQAPWQPEGFHYYQGDDYADYHPRPESGGEEKYWLGLEMVPEGQYSSGYPPYLVAFNPGQSKIKGTIWSGFLIKLTTPGRYWLEASLIKGDLTRQIISTHYSFPSLAIEVISAGITPSPNPTATPTPLPTGSPTPTPLPTPTTWYRCGGPDLPKCLEWTTSYFKTPDLDSKGELPVLVTNRTSISEDWEEGSPNPLNSANSPVTFTDNFSIRWEDDNLNFGQGGEYFFWADYDNGMRMIIDGIDIFGGWAKGAPGYKEATYRVGPGEHSVIVEYVEKSGPAFLNLNWRPVCAEPKIGIIFPASGQILSDPKPEIEINDLDSGYRDDYYCYPLNLKLKIVDSQGRTVLCNAWENDSVSGQKKCVFSKWVLNSDRKSYLFKPPNALDNGAYQLRVWARRENKDRHGYLDGTFSDFGPWRTDFEIRR
ncbi:hypothetical protein ISS42_02555 [Candidatus Shapirobacteria bacterium]|nr:hypothetical protein [Candidatus Shapirobacteria bacterium]